MFSRLFLCIALLAGLLGPVRTGLAQELTGARVQDAIDQTDRRIEFAESLVSVANNANATFELGLGRDIQVRARSAFSASQFGFAFRLTMDARGHADRAVAILRNLPDPDRVRVQVERTGDLLERTRDRLRECDDNRARALLRAAIDMQGRAEAALSESRFLAALQLTMSARERALRAMRICNLDDSRDENVARALSRTDEVLATAREALNGTEDARVVQGLRAAERMQGDAHSEFRAGHSEQALRMTQSARTQANRVMRRASSGAK